MRIVYKVERINRDHRSDRGFVKGWPIDTGKTDAQCEALCKTEFSSPKREIAEIHAAQLRARWGNSQEYRVVKDLERSPAYY